MAVGSRKKFLIFLLVIFALVVFAYVRRGIFLQQAKGIIEQNLERRLQCDFSIGKIKPGILRGFVLEDLKVGFPKVCGLSFNMTLERVFVDYNNLWETLFFTSGHPLVRKEVSSAELAVVVEDGEVSCGDFTLLKNLQGRFLLTQKGINFREIKAAIKQDRKHILRISGGLSQQRLVLEANLEHLKVDNFDILTNISLALDKKPELQGKEEKLSGTLRTYGSVLNKCPFLELNSSFEIRDEKLRILTFALGNAYDLRGIVSLNVPFEADLSLNFHQAAPYELFSNLDLLEKPDFSGLINGLIKISGPLKRAKVDGYLEAKQGHIGDLDFDSARINIQGRYPRILIVDSRIYRQATSFLIEGEMDFSNFEAQDFLDINLKADKGMLWQGWDITRSRENQVQMSKNIADDVKVTFDAFMKDEVADPEDDSKSELTLEYRMLGDKLLKLRLRKDEEILGVEKRLKF